MMGQSGSPGGYTSGSWPSVDCTREAKWVTQRYTAINHQCNSSMVYIFLNVMCSPTAFPIDRKMRRYTKSEGAR